MTNHPLKFETAFTFLIPKLIRSYYIHLKNTVKVKLILSTNNFDVFVHSIVSSHLTCYSSQFFLFSVLLCSLYINVHLRATLLGTHCLSKANLNSLRWSKLCDTEYSPAWSSHQKVVSKNTEVGWELKWFSVGVKGQNVPRKYPSHHYTTSSSLNCWYKAGWVHAFMLFMPNPEKPKLIRPGNILPLLSCPLLESPCEL